MEPLVDEGEVRDRATDAIEVAADYSELGPLLITVGLITLVVPLVATRTQQ